jgi:magnesium chelatase accessory protein
MLFDFDQPDFARDGRDWPNRAASRFVRANGIHWHVQDMGQGPVLLLIHGTGGATHSWRGLLPILAGQFRVVAPDLPGHGFTSPVPFRRMSLPSMAEALGGLIHALDVKPATVAGHSAGAAVAIRAALDGRFEPTTIIGLNAALMPFRGLAQILFPATAKLLMLNPVVPRFFSWQADLHGVRRLIESTGSHLDAEGIALYQRVIGKSGHAAAALAMMANWELEPLIRDLPRLKARLALVVGQNDQAVPPDDADVVAGQHPGTAVHRLPALGHLAHEEAPDKVAALIAAIVTGETVTTTPAPSRPAGGRKAG